MAEILDTLRMKPFVIPTSTLHCRDLMQATEDVGDDGHVFTVKSITTISYLDPFVGHMNV